MILRQEWANGSTATTNDDYTFKPDWVVYVKPWYRRFDLGACEVKTMRGHSGIISDYTKLGLEMRDMLCELVKEGVDDPHVCGILVKGYSLETYVMDATYLPLYRMVLLDSVRLPDSLASFSLFPTVFRSILQIKNIAITTAKKLELVQLRASVGKRKADSASFQGSNRLIKWSKK
ncbi:hypothetical protein DM01DRAFT_1400569 [Hesseltinella vesiculosa]|uniref:Fungal-type protein kinase domain-containing protein n=1 Tax=Hesseltinella vesiculosa TaxID=101127 RepID=A0A1X2G2E1_9FUNG|nr:hypothetical protein DM01DRAFT_1400569 [Hesseltinella vesiculosa]